MAMTLSIRVPFWSFFNADDWMKGASMQTRVQNTLYQAHALARRRRGQRFRRAMRDTESP